MNSRPIYLDNAATSFPKPSSVAREMAKCLNEYCGNAGRGSHRLSLLAASKIYSAREAICRLINAPEPENIVFVPTCTYGLNMIIKGVLKQSDHALCSDMEHNSVFRPLEKLKREGIISYGTFSALSGNASDEEIINDIKRKLQRNTRLLICAHQSNICSRYLPIEKIGELCKKNHVLFALDVAQSIGHSSIDMQKMNIDFLSAPGHKGLYGPQGSAFVAIRGAHTLSTLVEGGNGIYSLTPDMPVFAPERYEVGTLPLPSIVGLHEGINFINNVGIEAIAQKEKELFRLLRDGLMNITGATVYAPNHEGNTLSFSLASAPPERVCALLDEQNICVRGGFHCSALGHTSLGTKETGTVRASFGIYNTKNDIDRLLSIVSKI